jgi:thioredoxin 1
MTKEYRRKIIPVTRMDCPTCVATIETELEKLEGVKKVRINFLMKKIVVDYDADKVDVQELEETVEKLGYRISYKKYESLLDKILKIFRKENHVETGVFRRLNDHNFEELVLKSTRPVIVLFASPQCPTCKLVRPKLREIKRKLEDQIYVYELNVMETRKWEEYNVMSVPTILYFHRGKEIERFLGLVDKDEIEIKAVALLKA